MRSTLSLREHGLFGRVTERTTLETIQRQSIHDGTYVTIGGTSGCGKTSLVNDWMNKEKAKDEDKAKAEDAENDKYNKRSKSSRHQERNVKNNYKGQSSSSSSSTATNNDSWCFVSGRFEQHHSSTQPYSALIDSLDELFGKAWASGKRERSQLRSFYKRELRGDPVLEHFLPKVYRTLRKTAGPPRSSTDNKKNISSSHEIIVGHNEASNELGHDDQCDDSAEDNLQDEYGQPTLSTNRSFERLRTAVFKLLTQLTKLRPAAILLDDCQWADRPSLDLIQFIIEENLRGLMVIATYRSESVIDDEDKEQHPFICHLNRLGESKKTEGRVHDIQLSAFSLDETHELLTQITRRDKEATRPLVEVVQQKTGGNPFFIDQFIQLLQTENHLAFSCSTLQWEWGDVDEIRQAMAIVSGEVADVVASSLQRLDEDAQELLKVVSCLGSHQVSLGLLKEFFEQQQQQQQRQEQQEHDVGSDESSNSDIIILSVDPADVERLVEEQVHHNIFQRKSGQDVYCWSHDKIQQAAFSLIPDKALNSLRIRLGTFLMNKCCKPANNIEAGRSTDVGTTPLAGVDDEDLVCMATTLLNQVPIFLLVSAEKSMYVDEETAYKLAELNLKAAKLSILKSAFGPAMELLRLAVTAVNVEEATSGRSKWSTSPSPTPTSVDRYRLCLELYNQFHETAYLIGNHDEALTAIQHVIDHANDDADKFRAQSCHIEIAANGKDRDYKKALDMCLDILSKSHRIALPRNPNMLQKSWEKRRLNKSLPEGNLDNLLQMPLMTDSEPICISVLLSKVTLFAGLVATSFSSRLIQLAAFRSFQLSCAHGINTHTALAMAMYAFSLRQEGKIDDAVQLAKLADGILKNCNEYNSHNKDRKQSGPGTNYAKVQSIIYSALVPLHNDLEDSLEPFMDCYRVGVKCGEVEHALTAAMCYGYTYLLVGLPLSPLVGNMEQFGRECSHYGLAPSLQVQFPLMEQTIRNLRGEMSTKNKNPTVLSGVAMDQDDVIRTVEGKGQSMTVRDMSMFRLMLSYVYRDWDAAEEMLDNLAPFPVFNPSLIRSHIKEAFTGLAAFTIIRERKEKKYTAAANASLQYFKDAVKHGSKNAVPILNFILAVKEPNSKANDKAVRGFAKCGLVNFEAMANEHAAMYQIQRHRNAKQATTYLRRAMRLYQEWGATGKVKQIVVLHREQHQLQQAMEAAAAVAAATSGTKGDRMHWGHESPRSIQSHPPVRTSSMGAISTHSDHSNTSATTSNSLSGYRYYPKDGNAGRSQSPNRKNASWPISTSASSTTTITSSLLMGNKSIGSKRKSRIPRTRSYGSEILLEGSCSKET